MIDATVTNEMNLENTGMNLIFERESWAATVVDSKAVVDGAVVAATAAKAAAEAAERAVKADADNILRTLTEDTADDKEVNKLVTELKNAAAEATTAADKAWEDAKAKQAALAKAAKAVAEAAEAAADAAEHAVEADADRALQTANDEKSTELAELADAAAEATTVADEALEEAKANQAGLAKAILENQTKPAKWILENQTKYINLGNAAKKVILENQTKTAKWAQVLEDEVDDEEMAKFVQTRKAELQEEKDKMRSNSAKELNDLLELTPTDATGKWTEAQLMTKERKRELVEEGRALHQELSDLQYAQRKGLTGKRQLVREWVTGSDPKLKALGCLLLVGGYVYFKLDPEDNKMEVVILKW